MDCGYLQNGAAFGGQPAEALGGFKSRNRAVNFGSLADTSESTDIFFQQIQFYLFAESPDPLWIQMEADIQKTLLPAIKDYPNIEELFPLHGRYEPDDCILK